MGKDLGQLRSNKKSLTMAQLFEMEKERDAAYAEASSYIQTASLASQFDICGATHIKDIKVDSSRFNELMEFLLTLKSVSDYLHRPRLTRESDVINSIKQLCTDSRESVDIDIELLDTAMMMTSIALTYDSDVIHHIVNKTCVDIKDGEGSIRFTNGIAGLKCSFFSVGKDNFLLVDETTKKLKFFDWSFCYMAIVLVKLTNELVTGRPVIDIVEEDVNLTL